MKSSRMLGAWAGALVGILAAMVAEAQTAATPQAPAATKVAEKKIAEEKRIAAEKKLAAERFAVERARLVESPVFRAAKQWTPAVADDAAARLARVAELCPACKLVRPAEAVPLGELAAGAAPAAAGGGKPVLWLAEGTTPELRRDLETVCPECLQVTRPGCLPGASGGGMVVFSMVDSPSWNPGGEGDLCTVPPMIMFAAGALDTEIRAAIEHAGGATGVTVADYEAAAPSGCDRNLLMYRLSIAGQLLGGAR